MSQARHAREVEEGEASSLAGMIELRRFVGREFLLWLWFESEVFEATLSTAEHGSFGMWLEGRLVLSEGAESTVIRGSAPGGHREAKESLSRGKLPDRAGLHLSRGDQEVSFVLRGESMAFGGLVLPRKASEAESPPRTVEAVFEPRRRPKKNAGPAFDEAHEAFYERMRQTREIEGLVEALYQDFLALRLSPAWDETVTPALDRWVEGRGVDADRYASARKRALARRRGEGAAKRGRG